MKNENWKDAPGFPGYEVSDLGRVRNCGTGRVLRQSDQGRGYLKVNLNGRSPTVHRLVALAFLGAPPVGHVVNHLDGARGHNWAGNLEWTTQGDNVRHGVARGSYGKHSLKHDKYPPALRAELRRRVEAGESYSTLAREVNTTPMQVWNMVKREKKVTTISKV